MVELNQANQKLVETQSQIAEREKALSETLSARDITHGFGNMIGSLRINLKQSLKDIGKVIEGGDAKYLVHTKIALQNGLNSVEKSVQRLGQITTPEKQDIYLPDLIQERLKEVVIEKSLQEEIKYNVENQIGNEKLCTINTIRNSLSLCLHLLIDNAADALKRSLQSGSKESLYLKIRLSVVESVLLIDIIDNGMVIPKDIRDRIFDLNISTKLSSGGYGLWRAKYICEKEIGATLTLLPENWNEKIFRVTFPIAVSSRNAIIVDDDPAWRGILQRWLESANITVHNAATHFEAIQLLKTLSNVSYIFLDISLGEFDTNVDGLSLAKEAITYFPNAKRIILTAYPNRAQNYTKDVDVVLSKMDHEISDEDGFFNVLAQQGISIR